MLPLLAAAACSGSDAPGAGTPAAVEAGPYPADQASAGAAAAASEEGGTEDDVLAAGEDVAVVTGAPVSPPTAGPVQAGASQTVGGRPLPTAQRSARRVAGGGDVAA